MSCLELVASIRSDLRRYMATGTRSPWRVVFFYQGFWATFAYRVCRFLILHSRGTIFHYPVSLFVAVYEKFIQILTGIALPSGCAVGDGMYIGHFGGIIIHPSVSIGKNCNLAVQVLMGYGRSRGKYGYPSLGDRVFVGPGAKILGPVHIGNDVAIGANAVVTADVQDRAVVVGIPAKAIGSHGSFELIIYDGMENDPERLQSLALVSRLVNSSTEDDNGS